MDFNEIAEILHEEYEYANSHYVPIIRDLSAKFLFDFVRENNIKTVLEIGTAIGYSGSIMLAAGVKHLTTIDINNDYLCIAQKTFAKCKFDQRVQIYNNDAKIVLKELVNKGCQYDMIFLDGAKGQYLYYLDDLIKLIGKDGVIFADNVLLQGMVESNEKIPHRKRTMVVNLRKYLEKVNQSPLKTKLIRLEDGIAITRYEGE